MSGPYIIVYAGNYNWHAKTFSSSWEIVSVNDEEINGNMATGGYGKWKMTKI
jgi:hypothetical protein